MNKKRKFERNRRVTGLVLTAGMLAAALTGCGSGGADKASVAESESYVNTAYDASADAGIYEEYSEDAVYEETPMESGEGNRQTTGQAATDRKLIKTVNITAETEQFDSLLANVERQVTALGGYIEEMSRYNRNNSYYSDSGVAHLRYASMTVRIPRENLDALLSEVDEQSNIVSRSESVSDVTLQYVDLESHKKALLTEQSRLLELMEQAVTVEDIITIESRLSEVRYQIESMESQLRTYDNKIDYSTVYLSIDEVERYTPGDDISTGERIKEGFLESLRGVGNGFKNFGIWFVIHLPYLVVWAILIVAAIIFFIKINKHTAKRRTKKKAEKVSPYGQQQNPYVQNRAQTGESSRMEQNSEAAVQQPEDREEKQ